MDAKTSKKQLAFSDLNFIQSTLTKKTAYMIVKRASFFLAKQSELTNDIFLKIVHYLLGKKTNRSNSQHETNHKYTWCTITQKKAPKRDFFFNHKFALSNRSTYNKWECCHVQFKLLDWLAAMYAQCQNIFQCLLPEFNTLVQHTHNFQDISGYVKSL